MQIVCNGEPKELPDATTISALLNALELHGPVAVEVNCEVAPRELHGGWRLCDGDELEIVTLVGGG